jgi:hypothetical protein
MSEEVRDIIIAALSRAGADMAQVGIDQIVVEASDQLMAVPEPLCDMCEHAEHPDGDCGAVTGYDHLNGDHECGCPGSLASQLAQAWAEGSEAALEWINHNPPPSGIWSDPPTNPYEESTS